ncbi:MAG TPA: hypothetical protein VKB76_05850, partial [Ktedonobacterales bacterium]|nr:hypothetical protein [Ktedonobacterales bacterium]
MTFATIALLVITLTTLAALIWRAIGSPHLARIGARNVLRRMLRTALIVFGLMLATTLITTALAVNDTLIFTVKSVATSSVGLVDESITGGTGSLGLFSASYNDQTRKALQHDPRVADVAGALTVDNTLMVDQTSRQAHGGIYTLGMDPQHTGKLTTLQRQQSDAGNNVTLAKLATNEAYLNSTASQDLDARAGDTIAIFSPYWPQQRYQFHVRAILTDGPLGQRPTLLLPLAVVQGMVNAPNSINHIYIANAGSDLSSVDYSSAIAAKVQATLPHNFTVDQI